MATTPTSSNKRRPNEQLCSEAPPPPRRASPATSRASGVSQEHLDRAIAAALAASNAEYEARRAADLSAMEARRVKEQAELDARFAALAANLDARHASALQDSSARVQHLEADLNNANRVHDHLRAEAREAQVLAQAEKQSAVQHFAARTSAQEQLVEARAHHAATLEHETRTLRETAATAARQAEADAQRARVDAVSRTEAEASHRHHQVVLGLRSELAAAEQRPRTHHEGVPPPCPLCPVKQASIDRLNAELEEKRREVTDAQRNLREASARALHAEHAYAAAQQQFDTDLGVSQTRRGGT